MVDGTFRRGGIDGDGPGLLETRNGMARKRVRETMITPLHVDVTLVPGEDWIVFNKKTGSGLLQNQEFEVFNMEATWSMAAWQLAA